MTAEEFARRLKAEKQRDRNQKNESAQLLRGYRGGVKDDELKLKALKEEDRRKQQDAANLLRGYRGELKEEDLKLRAMKEEERQKHLEAEQLLHQYQKKDEPDAKRKTPTRKDPDSPYPPVTNEDHSLENIASGSVSAKLAQFDSPMKQSEKLTSDARFQVSPAAVPEGAEAKAPIPAPTAPFMEKAEEVTPGPLPEWNAGDAVPEPPTVTKELTTEYPDGTNFPPDVSDFPPENKEPKEPLPTPGRLDIQESEPAEHDAIQAGTIPTFAKGEQPAEEEKVAKEPHVPGEGDPTFPVMDSGKEKIEGEDLPGNVRFDLYFSFGIVTEVDNPRFPAYMKAVGTIVGNTLQEHQANIVYNKKHPPYVSDEKWDRKFIDPSGRSTAKRVLVTCGVPLILKNGTAQEKTQKIVTKGLAKAIKDKTFLELVKQQVEK